MYIYSRYYNMFYQILSVWFFAIVFLDVEAPDWGCILLKMLEQPVNSLPSSQHCASTDSDIVLGRNFFHQTVFHPPILHPFFVEIELMHFSLQGTHATPIGPVTEMRLSSWILSTLPPGSPNGLRAVTLQWSSGAVLYGTFGKLMEN